jgi:hypothetical protein
MAWRLEDVEARQRESPRTYPIPRSFERKNLRPGDLAKLVFLIDGNAEVDGERMWVEVESVEGISFLGRLTNQPRYVSLDPGDPVSFEPRHVAAVVFPPIDDDAIVIVSRRVLDDDVFPQRLIRQEAINEYSGWQVFAGDEPPGWASNADNARAVSVKQILDQFPVLESIFGDSTVGEWRWSAEDLEYVAALTAY